MREGGKEGGKGSRRARRERVEEEQRERERDLNPEESCGPWPPALHSSRAYSNGVRTFAPTQITSNMIV